MRAWTPMFTHVWRYATVFCAQMPINASLSQSAVSLTLKLLYSRKLSSRTIPKQKRREGPKRHTSYVILAVLYA